MAKLYIIYDERAMLMGTDEAVVLCTAHSLNEARHDVRSMFPGSPIYSYDIHGDQLLNEQFEECSRSSELIPPIPRIPIKK